MTNTPERNGTSVFKRAQQRHRRQGSAPNRTDDLSELVDFSNPDEDDRIDPIRNDGWSQSHAEHYTGPLYGLPSFPGFIYAPQALSDVVQMDLAFLSVSQYCEEPHRTNIDLVPPRQHIEENNVGESMWTLWKQQNSSSSKENGRQSQKKKKYRSFDKLSWSTMGYHYDWTARAYREEAKSPVPKLLARLASAFARTSLKVTDPSSSLSFTASACIVNYYNVKSIMGGHQDDLEYALDKPVVSISLGLPAVFLLGGKSKEDPVVPILVRAGDVMMMGGDSRLCYHGMARVIPWAVILPSVSKEIACDEGFDVNLRTEGDEAVSYNGISATENLSLKRIVARDSDKAALVKYLSLHRININVRQVLPDDVCRIPEKGNGQISTET